MREIRSKMAPSASETTKVAATVSETEKQETSEDLEETTDMPEEATEIATVATETEVSEESAICDSCVTLKAKVVALQKKCSRCVRRRSGPRWNKNLLRLCLKNLWKIAAVMTKVSTAAKSGLMMTHHHRHLIPRQKHPSRVKSCHKVKMKEHESRNEIRLVSLADKIKEKQMGPRMEHALLCEPRVYYFIIYNTMNNAYTSEWFHHSFTQRGNRYAYFNS